MAGALCRGAAQRAMRSRIVRIWLLWLLALACFAGFMWLVLMLPTPGGSATTLADLREFFASIGVGATIRILAVVFAPPILFTWFELWRWRRRREL